MAYLALYRQYRSRTLAEVVDQGHIVRTLGNAIKNGKLVHAYLFTGPRGTGKTSVARVMARSLNCEQGPTLEPCGICASCLAIDSGSALDVREIDAASNRGIDDIRDLRQSIQYVAESRYKIYIIDEVHMLSPEAFNALLKTLEEPPEHVIFILATTEVHKIPLTILSRCQRFDFHRIGKEAMIVHLKKIIQESGSRISGDALELLAERAQGGMRDALSMLDQCMIYASGEEIGIDDLLAILGSVDQETLLSLMEVVIASDAVELLRLLDRIEDSGRDLVQLLYDLMRLVRSIVAKPGLFKDRLPLGGEQAIRALDLLSRCEMEMKYIAQPRLALELALFRISEEMMYGSRIEALEARLAALEQGRPHMELQAPATQTRSERGTATGHRARPSVAQQTPRPAERVAPKENTASAEQMAAVVARQASQQAIPAGSDDALDTIKAGWEQILERIQKERISVHAILQHGRILSYDDGQLELVFAQDFHRKVIERPENRALLEQVLQSVCGLQCRIKALLTKDIIGRGTPTKPAVKSPSLAPHQTAPTVPAQERAKSAEDLLLTAAVALVGSAKVKVVG